MLITIRNPLLIKADKNIDIMKLTGVLCLQMHNIDIPLVL